MIQLELQTYFDGNTYEPELDWQRLTSQMGRVFLLMRDAKWRTLQDISQMAQGSEASVSARLRDLRKERFGAHTVNRRRARGGLFEYQVRET